MQIAFVLPSERDKKRIADLREGLLKLMPFQKEHYWHLCRSWGAVGHPNGLAIMEEALKRTLRDKP